MCIKIVFQWRPYRGEGILATVVKFYFQQIQSNKKSLYIDSILHFLYSKSFIISFQDDRNSAFLVLSHSYSLLYMTVIVLFSFQVIFIGFLR